MPTRNQNLENSPGMKDNGPWEELKSSHSSCYLPKRLKKKKKIPGNLGVISIWIMSLWGGGGVGGDIS